MNEEVKGMRLYWMNLDRWAMECLLEDAEKRGDMIEAEQLKREMKELDELIEAEKE